MAQFSSAEIAITAKDKTKPGLSSAKKGVGGLTKAVKSYGAEIGAAVAAVYGAIKVVKNLTEAYGKQEQAETKLTAALKATGRYSELTQTALHNFAKEMQNATGIGDELTIAAAGIMTTFTNIATETFPDALEAAANMSKMFGQDLQQSVIQLGTALNDPIAGVGRLKRIGISFSEEQKKSIELFMEQNDIMSAQRVILDELELEIGGVARAMGKTWKGQTEILTAAFGDLKEEMGRVIVNRMEPMLPVITRMVTATKDWIEQKNDLREAYKLINKEMEGTIKLTRIQLLQAEQDVALHELKKLKKQAELEVTTSTLGSLKTETSSIYDMIAAMENEIETRGKVIHSLLLNMEKAREGKEAIKDRSDALKDEVEIILTWRDQMALAGLDAAFFTNAIVEQIEATENATEAADEETTAIYGTTGAFHTIIGTLGIYKKTSEEAEEVTKTLAEYFRVSYQDAINQVTDALKGNNKAANAMMDIMSNLASGDLIGLVTSFFQALKEAIFGVTEELTDAQEAYLEFRKTLHKGVELIPDFDELADEWYKIRNKLIDSMAGGMSQAIVEFMETGDEVALGEAIGKSVKESIMKAMIDALIQQTIITTQLQPIIDNISQAIMTGADPTQYINQIKEIMPAIISQAEAIASAVSGAVSGLQQGGYIYAQGGYQIPGYGGGDVVPAMLEPGEMVIPKEVVTTNQALLNEMNSGQGLSNIVNVYLDGKKLQGVITKWTENGQLRIAPRAVR